MSSELKPLIANLSRQGISGYLITKDFVNCVTELDLDGEWKDARAEFEIEKGTDPDVYEEAFLSFVENLKSRFFTEASSQALVEIILDFYRWSPAQLDYKKVYACLKQAEIDADVLKAFPGKARKVLERKTEASESSFSAVRAKRDVAKVFVIHGHDRTALLELEKLLKEEFHLTPIILQENPNEGLDTIFAKFERLANECHLAIALFTPDDKTVDNSFRARQNVILEFGYFLGRDQGNDRKIIVLEKGKIETPSDINGVLNIRFNKSVNEVHLQLKKQLAYWKIIK